MRKNSAMGAEEEEASIDLTPMLDVVFIMLIFFIVTASFIKEAGIYVSRPDATTLEKIPDANILIAISAADEIATFFTPASFAASITTVNASLVDSSSA